MNAGSDRNNTRGGGATIPRRGAAFAVTGLLLAVILLGIGGYLWFSGAAGGPQIGGPFTLVNGDGNRVTDQQFHGKFMLVYFGYTYCPDVCPTTLSAVGDAMDKLGTNAGKVQPLFITVDPRRDTPEVVKQYAAAFSPRLIGLTGTPDEIAKVAKEYRVYYTEHRTGPGPNDYSMDHSSVLYLMGPNGQFVAPIRADASGDQMATQIEKYLHS
jgi:protein SCO1/2